MTVTPSATAPVQALLAHAIDYAGLFPPAGLELGPALESYLSYRDSPAAWALGRFVIPAVRLPECGELLDSLDPARPVSLSVLLGTGTAEELGAIERFERGAGSGRAVVAALEFKAWPEAGIPAMPPALAARPRYVEVPLDQSLVPALERIARTGGLAKVRSGGVTPDAFPDTGAVTRFLAETARRRLPFKATAGLHHALRGSYPLTYAPDSPRAVMYGFLNFLLAGVQAFHRFDPDAIRSLLQAGDSREIRGEPGALILGDYRFEVEELKRARRWVHGFGSCSFREPMEELDRLMEPG